MKITRITQQVKRRDRVSIYIDGKYQLSLSQDQLLESGLRNGDEVSEAGIARLLELSELGKALAFCYNYLSFRPRSRQEIQRHLQQKYRDSELVDEVIAQLEHQGLLNDVAFAQAWVENRQLTSPRSKRELKAELQKKGIAADSIELTLGSLLDSDEIEAINQLIVSKGLLKRYSSQQKLITYLAQKGYSYSNIKQALEATP